MQTTPSPSLVRMMDNCKLLRCCSSPCYTVALPRRRHNRSIIQYPSTLCPEAAVSSSHCELGYELRYKLAASLGPLLPCVDVDMSHQYRVNTPVAVRNHCHATCNWQWQVSHSPSHPAAGSRQSQSHHKRILHLHHLLHLPRSVYF